MSDKMRVDFEDLLEKKSFISDVNRAGFDGIDFYHDGRLVVFDEKTKKAWDFIGLNIVDFLMEYDNYDLTNVLDSDD